MRLEVTRKSDLAVRALCELNDAPGVQSEVEPRRMKGPELAERVGSTAGFLSQVMTPLVRAGWVRSDAGPTGGYSLAAPLDEVTILAVIEAIEGPTDTGQCVLVDRACAAAGPCALHAAWQRARGHLLQDLDAVTIADVAASGDARFAT
jgi:Rrf2 family protein